MLKEHVQVAPDYSTLLFEHLTIPRSKLLSSKKVSARLRLHVLTRASAVSSSSSSFAQYGATLLQATNTEEREQAAHLLDDPDERHTFTKRLFGASLGQQSGSPVDLSDATVTATPNIVPSSIISNPGTRFKDSVTQLLPLINANSAQQSPLLALNEQVGALFKCGPDIAVFIFSKLQLHIKEKTYKRTGAIIEIGIFSEETDLSLSQDRSFLWKSYKMAATLVLLFATSDDPEDTFRLASPGLPASETGRQE
ncbi:hypothetical protein BGZ57DRAFT_855121 [Hyaloscypha finlandica]|nr:hypothetical protein BGZ57DRAFT_855121 [Hyaloscypha finlandica]